MSDTATVETFIDAVLSGRAFAEDIDDWIDRWHDATDERDGLNLEMYAFLGMTEGEYKLWVEQSHALRFIIAAHRMRVPVSELLVAKADYALAARAQAPGDAQTVLQWLIDTGRINPDQASHA